MKLAKIIVTFGVTILTFGVTSASQHALSGIATWYGTAPFVGNRTPSGIICDGRTPQAAHKTLPFGTIVDVVEVNGRGRVRVIITDRGPFVKGRVVDLNAKWTMDRVCGKKCGMARVRLEVVNREHACRKYRCLSKKFGKRLDEDEIKEMGLTWPPE